MVWTLPNLLSLFRICIIPVLVYLLTFNDRTSAAWAAVLFLIASITDYFDGYFARRNRSVSDLGKILDPLADKLLSTAGLVMLGELGRVSGWIAILLIAREITITGLRGIAASEGLEMAASDWGKKKTILLSVALGALMVHYPFWGIDPQRLGTIVLWVTLAVSMGSGAHYVWTFFRAVMQGQNKST